MDKDAYLGDPRVASFCTWLAGELVAREFHLRLLSSRFVPNGIDAKVEGVESVLERFAWHARWTSPVDGTEVLSGDWTSTAASLERLKSGLETAMADGDEALAYEWCRRVLAWGGVSGAVSFLGRKRDEGALIGYLNGVRPLFRLDDPELHLETIDDTSIHRFDAGLTKIHAILDDSGSPIYDSRVGAAIAMFVALYCREHDLGSVPEPLVFPTGDARGNQPRNPGELGLGSAPKLYSSFAGARWARCMVRLGWIMEAALEASEAAALFADHGDLRDRLVTLQGALFMLGYDLRCFEPDPPPTNPEHVPVAPSGLSPLGNRVPTGFSMDTVRALFGAFVESDGAFPDDRQGFIAWQLAHGGVESAATAAANCYPLGPQEFDLFGATQARREAFIEGGPGGLATVIGDRFPALDERDLVCLTDCHLAGHLADRRPPERTAWLVEHGVAGTENTANLLLSVGRSVGRHFGLLDGAGTPTEAFEDFFARDPWR